MYMQRCEDLSKQYKNLIEFTKELSGLNKDLFKLHDNIKDSSNGYQDLKNEIYEVHNLLSN